MKAARVISFFPLLKLNDWFPYKTFWQDLSGKERNLDSDWLAQINSTKIKCQQRYGVQGRQDYLNQCFLLCLFILAEVWLSLSHEKDNFLTWKI